MVAATEDGNKNDREEDTSSRTKAVCEGVGQPSALSQLNASLDPAITLTQYLKEVTALPVCLHVVYW